MRVEEDVSKSMAEVDLEELEVSLVHRLSDSVTSIRAVYRRDHTTHALIVQWMLGTPSSGIYELLIEITSPHKEGHDIWPFTLWEEMDLLQHNDDRWDVERVTVSKMTRKRTNTVILKRYRNRTRPT